MKKKYVVCSVCRKTDTSERGHVGTATVMRCTDCAGEDGRATRCRDCCVTGHHTRYDEPREVFNDTLLDEVFPILREGINIQRGDRPDHKHIKHIVYGLLAQSRREIFVGTTEQVWLWLCTTGRVTFADGVAPGGQP